jgi:hypothetical protein
LQAEITRRKEPPLPDGDDGRRILIVDIAGVGRFLLRFFSEECLASPEIDEWLQGVADRVKGLADLSEKFWPDLLPTLRDTGDVDLDESLVGLAIDKPQAAIGIMENPEGVSNQVGEFRAKGRRPRPSQGRRLLKIRRIATSFLLWKNTVRAVGWVYRQRG